MSAIVSSPDRPAGQPTSTTTRAAGAGAQPAAPGAAPRVDEARLWDSLMTLARIGATAKGRRAQARRSPISTGRAATWSCGWARDGGLRRSVSTPSATCSCAAPAATPAWPAVAIGSHIDTQPTGGKFDGNYGVLAGLEVVRDAERRRARRPRAPLEVCVWTNEEGSRFVPVMMGSGVYAGAFTLEHALARAIATASAWARRWQRSATPATPGDGGRGRRASTPTSRRTSSRARCWRTRAHDHRRRSTGALGPALVRRRSSPARTPTPARRRWRCAATRCSPRRAW